MDAEITPHRSLSSRGVVVLICVVTAFDAVMAAIFVAMGAGPIPIFLGIGLIALIVALLASNRAMMRRERIQVSELEVRVVKEERGARKLVWVSPTASTRVRLVDDDAGDRSSLSLHLSDRTLTVAEALTRRERREFARALDRAIWRARNVSRAI